MVDGLRRTALILGALVLVVVVSACTVRIEGRAAAADPAGLPTQAAPSSTTRPAPDIVAAPPEGDGRRLEAHRLAGATALVQDSFAERSDSCFPTGPALTADRTEAQWFVPGTAAQILDDYGFVAAWGQCSRDADGNSSITLSIELSDPTSAGAAATELAAASASGSEVIALAGGTPALLSSGAGVETAQIFATSGRVLAYTRHEAPEGQGVSSATRLSAEQLALLSTFVPTPQADVPNLPLDPNGLAAFALDTPGPPDDISGPFDLESYLRIAIDPFRERELLTANGFTGMFGKQSAEGSLYYAVALYAFPTSAQTNTVYNAFAELETSTFGGTPFTLPSIPDAPCFVFDSGVAGVSSFYQRCYVGYGSYLASLDVGGLTAADDVAAMDSLLPAQRDLIDG